MKILSWSSAAGHWLVLCKKLGIGITGVFISVNLVIYLSEADTRHERMPSCEWSSIENHEQVAYSARWCKLTKDTVVLRLYELDENRLVVERSFPHFDGPHFFWDAEGIGYDSQDGGDVISLPPTAYERFRARLP